MVNIFDVAIYILDKIGGTTSAMKLHKLCYYSQAWSLVWDDAELFSNKIEAWAYGPVIPDLYSKHQGKFAVDKSHFINFISKEHLSTSQKETIDVVLKNYADKSSQWLSDQTHSEIPWKEARKGIPEYERSSQVITLEAMACYYGALCEA